MEPLQKDCRVLTVVPARENVEGSQQRAREGTMPADSEARCVHDLATCMYMIAFAKHTR